MTLASKFNILEDQLNDEVFERTDEIHSAILALLSRRHMFMFGTPGVAKSFVVDRLVERIDGLEDGGYFKWLLTKFSVPEEIFGGPDFKVLKDEGIYKRITTNKLPVASVAFLDEAFKANSAILNSLLKILNEREFDNCDDDPHVPLLSVFAASNELPASRELDALADRLHFWHYVKPIAEPANFVRMLKLDVGEPDKVISLDDIKAAQEEVQKVQITDTIYEVFVNLSDQLRTADVPVTDRRFHQSIGVIQAEAWLNGREVAEVADMKPLMHMLWRTVEHIDKVRTIVLNLVDPLEKMVLDLQSELDKAVAEWDKTLLDTDVKAQRVQASLEMHDNFKKAKKEFLDLKAIEKENGRICKAMNSLEKTLKTIAIRIDEELGLS
jgi:MoxR-like ATPase